MIAKFYGVDPKLSDLTMARQKVAELLNVAKF